MNIASSDEYFLAGVAAGNRDRRRLTKWLEEHGQPGEDFVEALIRHGYLIPEARRVVWACRVGYLCLPSTRQLFTSLGRVWLTDHAGARADNDVTDTPTHIFETVPGVQLSDELTVSFEAEPDVAEPIRTVGSYRLHQALGRGGAGMVYEAESIYGGERLALKLLPTGGYGGSSLAERYFNGAAVAQHLGLPGCLAVHAAAREFGYAFVVTPKVVGGSIRDRAERNPLAAAEATTLCGKAARSLSDIHAAGYAHGNIKAGNLLIGHAGVVLTDFALPDAALVPRSSLTPSLQRADVAALIGVYADLLTDPLQAPPACRDVLDRRPTTAAALVEAFDVAAAAISAKLTAPVDSILVPCLPGEEDDLPPEGTPRVGDQLGKCLLTRKIGEGGTGVVFRATHQTLGIDVAVKVLSTVTQAHKELAAQFSAEARMLARLNHPNIVRIWDFEAQSQFPPFLVLEFVDGQNLEERIKAAGPVPPADAVPLFSQVVSALAAAHKRTGLIHRDIKPANILLGADGVVKVADLGLASILETEKEMISQVAGTVAYMPPEQAEGVRATDHRSDIYALGATMYHAVTGTLPFTGRARVEVLFKHANVAPVPPDQRNKDVPRVLSEVIMKMLAKRPEDRYQTYDDLGTALAEADSHIAGKHSQLTESPPRGSLFRRLFTR